MSVIQGGDDIWVSGHVGKGFMNWVKNGSEIYDIKEWIANYYLIGRDSSFSIVTGMDDRGSIPDSSMKGVIYFHHRTQAGSGAHPDSYTVGTEAWELVPRG